MVSKVQERIYAEKAIELLAVDWTLEDIPDPPDFEIRSGVFFFGLEVRQIFAGGERDFGSPQKRSEKIKSSLVSKLAEQFYELGGRPINVKVLGGVSDESILPIARALVSSTPQTSWKNASICLDGVKVFVTRLPDSLSRYSRWTVVDDRVGWPRQVSSNELQSAIDKKADNLRLYKDKYADIDLLLVADRTFNSGRLLPPGVFRISNPGFRSVYFLSYPESIVKIC